MLETKNFHLSDVLCVTTGRLVSTRQTEGVYDILGWMSGECLFTHQLPRILREAEPVLSALYHQLSKAALSADLEDLDHRLTAANGDKEKCSAALAAWLDGLTKRLGSEFAVPKLNEDQHECIDPMSELVEKVHPDNIITVRT